jgi:hypothetical protein
MFQFKQESYTGNFTISQSMIHGTQMDVTEGDIIISGNANTTPFVV